MFCLDIETLGSSGNAVVLSAALIYFDEKSKYTFDELIEDSCFVKFNVREQTKLYNRSIEKDTVDWWKKQTKFARDFSVQPKETDLSIKEGINILKDYIVRKSVNKEEIVWTRGSLDQFVLDDLCKNIGEELLFKYSVYRDMRTAIDLLKETAKGGYCEIPGLDMNRVYKHIPTHDCALDILMLLEGK